MSNPLANVQRSMSADAEMLRLIADNIANSHTVGYQRKVGVQRAEFSLPVDLNGEPSTEVALDGINTLTQSLAERLNITTDKSPGALVQTREPLDIALNGAGSLIASTSTGDALIRGGKFKLDAHGVLVTQAGDPVLGVSGPINFAGAVINHNDIEITADGTVKLGGNVVGQLRVQAPDLLSDKSQSTLQEPVVPRVMQGFVEQSNVDSVTEMLNMMEVFRHFEASQKALRSYDGLLQQAISDLGKI